MGYPNFRPTGGGPMGYRPPQGAFGGGLTLSQLMALRGQPQGPFPPNAGQGGSFPGAGMVRPPMAPPQGPGPGVMATPGFMTGGSPGPMRPPGPLGGGGLIASGVNPNAGGMIASGVNPGGGMAAPTPAGPQPGFGPGVMMSPGNPMAGPPPGQGAPFDPAAARSQLMDLRGQIHAGGLGADQRQALAGQISDVRGQLQQARAARLAGGPAGLPGGKGGASQ